MTLPPLSRPRAILAANAIPLNGGQGMNLFQMVAGLAPSADLEVFAAGPCTAGATQVVSHSTIASLVSRVPLLRRARGWVAMIDDVHFDSWVARRLRAAQWFHGVTGQCTKSLRAARELGMPTVLDVITAHIDEFVEQGVRECALFRAPFAIHRSMQERILEEYVGADRIRVMSTYALGTFVARGFARERMAVVHPPLTLERHPETRRPRRFCVGFVGALEPWKGMHYLVEAFRRAAAADWRLRLVGGTGARGTAAFIRRTLRKDSRIEAGPADVRRAGVERVYGSFSVLVHPSVCDGFGQSVAEAMACAVPVIVTSTTGAADLVEHGQTGFVVPPRDAHAIAACLCELAANPDLCEHMGRRARAITMRYSAEQFRQEYRVLLDGRVSLSGPDAA